MTTHDEPADDRPERYAVIDVGTNSVKFHVGERDPASGWRTIVDRAEVTRLGEGLAARDAIGPEAIARTADAIAQMAEESRGAGVLAIATVGTAGLRSAANRDEVIAAIHARAGVHIDVISGDDESRLAYVAVRAGLNLADSSIVVFDAGGGSSQFTFGEGSRVDERFSVDVGAARYTERFGLDGLVGADVLRDAIDEIAQDLSPLAGRPRPDQLVGLGGAVTNMTAVRVGLQVYDPAVVQGATLDTDEVDRQIERYRSLDAEARRTIVGLQPERAEVILAGACIVRTILGLLDRTTLTVSDRGLRHGVHSERFGP
jgi:exopolyphosphatase/guanosine-5'-triphosphate,3'-diphosphate pyrophosphatase